MPVRALLVDGFGTLLDWSNSFPEVHENALRRAHAEADSVVPIAAFPDFLDAWRALEAVAPAGTAEPDLAERFKGALERVGAGKRQVRVLAARMHQRYFHELQAQVRLASGAHEFLRAVPEDVKLALVADHPDGTTLRLALDRLDVFYRFDVIVASGDPEHRVRKPDPRLLAAALADLDVDAADALMIGDGPEDAEAARAVGARVVLVRDAHGAAAVVPSLADVPAFLAKLE